MFPIRLMCARFGLPRCGPLGQGRYRFQDLAYHYANMIMQPFIVTLDPSDKPADLVSHRGEEFNLVLKGTVVVTHGDKEIILNAGDSIYFNPTYPHGQRCGGNEPAVFLTMIAE